MTVLEYIWAGVMAVFMSTPVGEILGIPLPIAVVMVFFGFLSGILVGYGIWLRRRLPETPAFREVDRADAVVRTPLRSLVTRYPVTLLAIVAITPQCLHYDIVEPFGHRNLR